MEQQLKMIMSNIEKAAVKSGRTKDDITLIGVSKTYPVEAINEAIGCGIRDFGENKVQELVGKVEAVQGNVNWHLIGHLQTNKVKYITGKVALIHSVDSMKLAQEIQKQSEKMQVITPVLIQVNIAREESKYGFEEENIREVVREIATFSNVQVKGFMTIAPFVKNPEENRPIFRKLFNLSVDIQKQNIDNISTKILSMGMSNDYMVAIEEGANMVRIGTALFGERDYSRH